MQVLYDADGIPSDFPILGLHTVVARGFVETGGEKSEFEKQYLLAKSATRTISVVIHQSHPGRSRLEALLLDSGQLQRIELVE